MRLDEVRNLNHDDNFIFAIAVGIENGFAHCAILYKCDDGRIRTLDFWNQGIRSSQSIGDFGYRDYLYIFYNQETIIEPMAVQVPAICELIKEKKNKVNFGIGFTDTIFDDEGKLVLADKDFGLTCATFILAVFQRAGITLIDLKHWEYRDLDLVIQKRVLDYYKAVNKGNPQAYNDTLINQYENNLGCFRYRPEEVGAASASSELPARFIYCNEYGNRILEALNEGLEYYNVFYPI